MDAATCSDACRKRLHRERRRPQPTAEAVCGWCDKGFRYLASLQEPPRFCSTTCARLDRYERMDER